MTRTVFLADYAQADRTSVGQRTSPASSLVGKALDAAQGMFAKPVVALAARQAEASQLYPWLSTAMYRNMSARAQRLMRADY